MHHYHHRNGQNTVLFGYYASVRYGWRRGAGNHFSIYNLFHNGDDFSPRGGTGGGFDTVEEKTVTGHHCKLSIA